MNPNDPANTPPAAEPTPDVAPAPEVPVEPAMPAPEAPISETPASEAPTYDAPVEPATPVSSDAPVSSSPFEAPAPEAPAPEEPPVAAAAPGAVFAASSVGGPAPKTPNKNKILLLAGIIGGVILLAVVGVIVYLMLTTVSREDYTAALKQYNEVSRASTQLESKALSLSSNARADEDDGYKESLAEMKEAVATIKTENEELSKLKAVRVGEGAEHYKVFNDKVKGYLGYADGLVASIEAMRPALLTCNEVNETSSSDTSAAVAAMRSCATALGDVKDVPNESFKTYIGALNESYVSLADIYEKVAALTNPYGAQYEEYKALRDQLRGAQDKISDASTEFKEAMNDSDEKYSPKESAKVLGEFLQEKQNA